MDERRAGRWRVDCPCGQGTGCTCDLELETFRAARAVLFERLRVQSEVFRLEEAFALPAVLGRAG